jgi:hypothetical protein
LQGEFTVGRCEGTDKVIFERLDGTFCRINAVVVWFNEHELAIFVGEKFLDLLRALIVHNV